MRHYEATIVLDPAMGEDGIKKQMDRTKSWIEGQGGRILVENNWGIRSLAYPIAKKEQGFYAIVEFEAPGESIGELDTQLRLEEHVLRHLVIYMDPRDLVAREEQKQRRIEQQEEGSRRRSSDEDDDDEAESEEDDE